MASDEELALDRMDRIIEAGSKVDFAVLWSVVQKHSVQWLVDAYQRRDPCIMAISAPSLMASFPQVDNKEDTSVDEETWEGIKRSISQTVSDYLK